MGKKLNLYRKYVLSYKITRGQTLVEGRSVHIIRADPKILIYKFRYVAKGYSQIYGIDYFEIFEPMAIVEYVRILTKLVVNFDLLLHQMDVESAYLHAPLKCDVYICQPPGFAKLDKNGNELIWKLSKSLYDLKQNGRNWCNLLYNFLIELCFVKSKVNRCIYV